MARHEEEQSSRRKRYEDDYSSGRRPRDSYPSSSRRRSLSRSRSRSPDLDRHRRRRENEEHSSTRRHRREEDDDWRRREGAQDSRMNREQAYSGARRDGERDDARSTGRERRGTAQDNALQPRSSSPERAAGKTVLSVKSSAETGASPPAEADTKLRSKKEKLEAWRKERERKALEEAKQRAAAVNASLNRKGEGQSRQSEAGDKLRTSTALSVPMSEAAPTSIKASSLKGLPIAARPDFSKGKQGTVSAMDDVGDQPKQQLERFTLPPMSAEAAAVSTEAEAEEAEEIGLVDDDEVHGNREDVTAALQEKRKAAAKAEEEKMQVDGVVEEDDEDVDPLDAFMVGVSSEVKQVNAADRQRLGKGKEPVLAEIVGGNGEDDDGDEDEGARGGDELDQAEIQDLMALAASKVKKKDMAVVDHSRVNYEPFRKAFYHPPAEVEEMTEEDAERLRMELDAIKVRGKDCPKPLTKWSHCGLPGSCLDVIKKLEYSAPTAIQSQAIPAIMSGRDMIGVAKTGSGKTMAFLLPMFRHIKDQRKVATLEGPIGLIMTPTRELAVQIFRESKPFLKALGLRAVCVYGGAPISEQIAEMKRTAEIVVATPGRMIDLLTANSGRVTNLERVTYLVLDEADRMFDMGFEPQVMKIVNNVRPDRQTVLFSATFPKQMESLARKVLKNKPLEIIVGGRSVVAEEIEQIVEVREENSKFNRLLEILGMTYMEDEDCRTLIFVERQESADDLLKELMKKGYPTMSLHGGKDQVDRDSTIADFKAGVVPIVTATSVAARGLDVKQLKLVVNYDAPNHMEDYVHRAGRTGRAGNKGTCITFITPEQDKYARDIISALKASKRAIPAELDALAQSFREKVQSGKAHVSGSGFGGKGLERFESDREKALAVQKSSFGEGGEEQQGKATTEVVMDDIKVQKGPALANEELQQVSDLQIEVKRGLAPESVRDNKVRDEGGAPSKTKKEQEEAADNALLARNATMLDAAKANGADTTKLAQALAKINAAAQQRKMQRMADEGGLGGVEQQRKGKDPDATDYHAIVPINDFPQRARWRVTNKETMTNLISDTGASITNKGVFYEKGKEPQPGEPPKLQLLVESNDESKVEAAVREIKQLLLEATQAALEAEQRNPGGPPGRYNVL